MPSRLSRYLLSTFGALLVSAVAYADPAVTATRIGNFSWVANHVVLLTIPSVFLFSGWSANLRTRCRNLARQNWFWTIAFVAFSYWLVTGLCLLPVSYIRFSLLNAYLPGLHQHAASRWFVEEIGTLLIETVAAAFLAWIPYGLLSRSPRRWWLWSSVLLSPIVLFILILQPFWISPFTSQYTPLEDASLTAEISQLAERCGVKNAEVFVGGDDYQVSGLGPTKRILIGTAYAKEFTPPQLRFLIGHELGHNVNGDNWKAWAAISAALLAGFYLTQVVGKAAINRWHSRFSFHSLSDPASLPLIVFIVLGLVTVTTPFEMIWSRHIEHEADRFGLELTHENRAAASMFAGFEHTYLESPDPGWLAMATRWNHPPGIERIRFAVAYQPWLNGTPLSYGNVCRMP